MSSPRGGVRLDGAAFARHVHHGTPLRSGQRVGVALSGGLDSTVLLHLLRFGLNRPGAVDLDVRAVHLDHGMRSTSAADAQWVAGLCRAWCVPLRSERASPSPTTEEEARNARYDLLQRARRDEDLDWVVTAHHADDQAETVLFRAVRGTGIRGLAGIPRTRDGWLLRPLLPFCRDDIHAYASYHGIRWREDPSNTDRGVRRNALRHTVLPALERHVAPNARRSLVALADAARESETAIAGLAEAALAALLKHEEPGRIVLSAPAVSRIPRDARSELLRAAARRLGSPLTRTGTRIAVQVSSPDSKKGSADLGGGIRLSRQYEDLVMESALGVASSPSLDSSLRLPLGPGESGQGQLTLGGRSLVVRWSPGEQRQESASASTEGAATFSRAELTGPLTIRSWRPGDRMRLPYGSKKLKRLYQEARLPRWRRARQPLLVDGESNVLWAPGLRRGVVAQPASGEASLEIVVDDCEPVENPPTGTQR